MVYHDDSAPPISDYRTPYDPWDEPGNPSVAPSSDNLRQAINEIMDRHPKWSPSQIRANLWRQGLSDVSLGAICGVKAGL